MDWYQCYFKLISFIKFKYCITKKNLYFQNKNLYQNFISDFLPSPPPPHPSNLQYKKWYLGQSKNPLSPAQCFFYSKLRSWWILVNFGQGKFGQISLMCKTALFNLILLFPSIFADDNHYGALIVLLLVWGRIIKLWEKRASTLNFAIAQMSTSLSVIFSEMKG